MKALQSVLDDWQGRALAWDRNCGMFAADCVAAQTGVDPIADFRDRITSARSFAAILRQGDGSIENIVTQRLGLPVPPRQARRGDIVGRNRGGLALGVCMGSVALFLGDNGLMALPMRDVDLAWRVSRG